MNKNNNNNKKVKKPRGTVLSLNSFLGDTPTGHVVKKIPSLENEDGYDDIQSEQIMLQLPTAPKANRLFNDDSISHSPPFVARLSNLPFDGDEQDIRDFFRDFHIVTLHLPREDGETGRVRGYGNVEFENRDDFIRALSLPDPVLKGRRIRIEQLNDYANQSSSQRSNKRGYSNFGDSRNDRESTNWRENSSGSGHVAASAAGPSEYGMRQGDWRENTRTNRNETTSSSWRNDRNRPNSGDFSSWRDRADDEKRRDNFGDDRQTYSSSFRRNRNDYGGRAANKYDNMDSQSTQRPIEERPRLELKPRTLPMPEIVVQEDKSQSTQSENSSEFEAGVDVEANNLIQKQLDLGTNPNDEPDSTQCDTV